MLCVLGCRRTFDVLIRVVLLTLTALTLLSTPVGAHSTEDGSDPAIWRWAFKVLPDGKADFAADFRARGLPILRGHGFIEAQNPTDRTVADSIYSHFFVDDHNIAPRLPSLRADTAWAHLLREWQVTYAGLPGGLIANWPEPYWHPAGPGSTRPLGPGRTVPAGAGRGHWHTFDVLDGLASVDMGRAIFEDSRGALWFTSFGSGVSRFDGQHFTTYNTRDGLISLEIAQILEDQQGNLWFRTGWRHEQRGVSLFDGETFTNLTVADGLPRGTITGMATDPAGAMWFALNQGLARFVDGYFDIFSSADGLADDEIWQLLSDKSGRLWVGTRSGLSQRSNESPIRFESVAEFTGGAVLQLLEDRTGRIWCRTMDHRVGYYDGRTWTMVTLPPELSRGWIRTMLVDSVGQLWVAGESGLVGWSDGQSWELHTIETDFGAKWSILSLTEDDQGNVWIGTLEGVERFDGESFHRVTSDDGLSHNSVQNVYEDRQGNLWFGTYGGLSRYGKDFVNLTTAEGLAHDMVSRVLWGPQGNLWIGTHAGLTKYDGLSYTTYTTDDGLAGNDLYALTFDATGRLWIGTTTGFSRIEGDSITSYFKKDGLADGNTLDIAFDQTGNAWLLSGNRAVHYDGRAFDTFSIADGMPGWVTRQLLVDRQGDGWFANSQGVSRLDGDRITAYGAGDGLVDQSIFAVFEDRDGDLWFGSDGHGVSRYDGDQFVSYNTEDGLAHEALRVIRQDRAGHMWFGTDGGLVGRFDGQVFQTLSRLDGLNGQSIRDITQGPDGDYWFATHGGLTRYHPPPPVPPGIFIDAVLADQRYENPRQLQIPSTADLIAFEFHGSSPTTAPDQLVYYYRLVGYHDEWHTTRERRLEFTDLPSGNYRLEIKAVDRDLVYSSEPATVKVDIIFRPTLGTLALQDLAFEELFASYHADYAGRPLGSIRVVNNDADTVAATLTWQLTDWMARPEQQSLVLPPGVVKDVELTGTVDASILDLEQLSSTQARVDLSFAVGDQTISLTKEALVEVQPRGAMWWDSVARAAAFITPADPAVMSLARSTLVALESETRALGEPGHHLLQAMTLFENLRQLGVGYLSDASPSTGRARDREAIDDIQYPAEVLRSKAGDCDDLTVLFCSLLESAGIATALVDFPGHVFLLFDSGISRWDAYKLPIDQRRFILREDRLWIPVEVTRLDGPFDDAWRAGADELAQLSGIEQRRLILNTAQAWETHPPAMPQFDTDNVEPDVVRLREAISAGRATLAKMIDSQIEATYLIPMRADPDNGDLRTRLLRVYVALSQYDDAISAGLDFLIDDRGDQAATYNHLGISHYLKGEIKQSAFYFLQALALSPDDAGIRRNHEQAMWALGRSEAPAMAQVAASDGGQGADGRKGADGRFGEESFYWVETPSSTQTGD